jgi:hypothetical protein
MAAWMEAHRVEILRGVSPVRHRPLPMISGWDGFPLIGTKEQIGSNH